MKVRSFTTIFQIIALSSLFLTGSQCHASTVQTGIRVGAEDGFSPYSFIDANGRAAGFSVDLINAVAKNMGLSAETSTGKWDKVWNSLISGKVDVLPIVARSPGRDHLVDFSIPHTETFDAFFTRKGVPPISNIEAARGKKIVVMRSDAAHHELQARNFQNELVFVNSIPEGLSLISLGKYDALLCSKLIGTLEINEHGIKGLSAGPAITDYKRVFSFAVKKGDSELLEKLNQGLLIVKANGEYDRIYEKWLNINDPWHKYNDYLYPGVAFIVSFALLAGLWNLLLQWRVRRRTCELAEANAMLRVAQKELRELVEERTAELSHSKDRYKSHIEVTGQITWSTDADGMVAEDLPTWRRYTGQTFDEAKGVGWSKAIHPDDLAQTLKIWNESVAARKEYETEYRVRRHDGAYRHFLARGIPVLKEDGTIQEWVGVCIDITERKRLEDTAAADKQRLEAHINNSPLAVIEFDADFRVIRWSDAAEEMFGWHANEIIGKAVSDVRWVYEEDVKLVEKEYAYLSSGRTARHLNVNRNYRKDGSVIWCEWYDSAIYNNDGTLISIVSQVLDITEKKEAEKALIKAYDEMEMRVIERTNALQRTNEALLTEISQRKEIEAQMLRAQRMESIGTLAAGIAHDFNNILTPIMLNSTAALMDLPENHPIRKYVERTLSSANRAKELVKQILAFSRKGQFDLKILNFQDVIKEALKLLRASIPSTIEIRKKIGKCGPVLADPTQMSQVVMNLCTNAYQAIGEKGGSIEISLEEIDIDAESARLNLHLKPGRYCRFSVSDTGHGMDAATMERIFDPFFSTKGTGGTGLGLSVVQGIVIGHGGDIDVQSSPGQGTTFHIYLPRASEEENKAGADKEESVPVGKERILFVDDEEEIAMMGKEMLERLGYQVTAKTDSFEAVGEFQANGKNYDLVVTDFAMPKMNGLELAKELATINPNIKIILTSGFNEGILPEKLQMSAIAYAIKKPYSIVELATAIREIAVGEQTLT